MKLSQVKTRWSISGVIALSLTSLVLHFQNCSQGYESVRLSSVANNTSGDNSEGPIGLIDQEPQGTKVVILEKPEAVTNSKKISISFSVSGDVIPELFECRSSLAGDGNWMPCVSPVVREYSLEGLYFFEVRAQFKAENGEMRLSPVQRVDWKFDEKPPLVQVNLAPNSISGDPNPDIVFDLEDDSEVKIVHCSLLDTIENKIVHDNVKCESPLKLSGLKDNTDYALRIIAVDEAGNASQERRVTWTNRFSAPTIKFTKLPSNLTNADEQLFEFKIFHLGREIVSNLKCATDQNASSSPAIVDFNQPNAFFCQSPLRLRNLPEGRNRFAVRATYRGLVRIPVGFRVVHPDTGVAVEFPADPEDKDEYNRIRGEAFNYYFDTFGFPKTDIRVRSAVSEIYANREVDQDFISSPLSWTIDKTPPQLTILESPPAVMSEGQLVADIKFAANENASVLCRTNDTNPMSIKFSVTYGVPVTLPILNIRSEVARELSCLAEDAVGNKAEPIKVSWISMLKEGSKIPGPVAIAPREFINHGSKLFYFDEAYQALVTKNLKLSDIAGPDFTQPVSYFNPSHSLSLLRLSGQFYQAMSGTSSNPYIFVERRIVGQERTIQVLVSRSSTSSSPSTIDQRFEVTQLIDGVEKRIELPYLSDAVQVIRTFKLSQFGLPLERIGDHPVIARLMATNLFSRKIVGLALDPSSTPAAAKYQVFSVDPISGLSSPTIHRLSLIFGPGFSDAVKAEEQNIFNQGFSADSKLLEIGINSESRFYLVSKTGFYLVDLVSNTAQLLKRVSDFAPARLTSPRLVDVVRARNRNIGTSPLFLLLFDGEPVEGQSRAALVFGHGLNSSSVAKSEIAIVSPQEGLHFTSSLRFIDVGVYQLRAQATGGSVKTILRYLFFDPINKKTLLLLPESTETGRHQLTEI